MFRVLVADDDQEILNLLRLVLASKGFECETAASGDEALAKLRAGGCDIVVTDVKMPGMDGITLTTEIVRERPGTPVMVMTGFASEYSEQDAVNAGASDFVAKPFSLGEFGARLDRLVRDFRERAALAAQSRSDVLTGLPNRAHFLDRLNHNLASARRYGFSMAVLFVDLDRFKAVNDTLGHETGDRLLKEVSARLISCVRTSDTVARLGGDEFGVILSRIEQQAEAGIVSSRILTALTLTNGDGEDAVETTASIGISIFPEDGQAGDDLVRAADSAMYRVKHKGGKGYVFFRDPAADRGNG